MKPSGEAIQTRKPPLARSPNSTTFTVERPCHQTPLKAPIQLSHYQVQILATNDIDKILN